MQFFLVYIKEAHPIDGRSPDRRVKIKSPKTWKERQGIAKTACEKLDLSLPTLIDEIDNKCENVWRGWPDRLFVVDHKGSLSYKADRGPWGFKPDDWEDGIKKAIADWETDVPKKARAAALKKIRKLLKREY